MNSAKAESPEGLVRELTTEASRKAANEIVVRWFELDKVDPVHARMLLEDDIAMAIAAAPAAPRDVEPSNTPARISDENTSERITARPAPEALVEKISCKARKSYPDPLDCDWPLCDCDPHAVKVIAALEESGALTPPARKRDGRRREAVSDAGQPDWVALTDSKPRIGLVVVATDGKARWLDRYDGQQMYFTGMGYYTHRATHWYAVPQTLPTSEPRHERE